MAGVVQPIPLDQLTVGSLARVHATDLSPDAAHHVRSLGLTTDCQLRLCKAGEPSIVQVRSTRIGLARDVARHILVVPVMPGA